MSAFVASVDDIKTIYKLAETIWMEHYPSIIGEEQTLYMLDKMYNAEALTKQMQEGNQFFIWKENDVPIGFASIDYKNHLHGFLSKFYLDKNYRGQGIAQRFLEFLEQEFLKNTKQEIQLTVNRQNIGAINFYFKAGFKILRCADFDIGNGYFMNDFVMGKVLGPLDLRGGSKAL